MTRLIQTNRIYHYCSLKTAIEYILPYKRLILNPIGNTNDPRENKSFGFAGRNMNNDFSKALHELNSEISQEIRKDCKLICFSMDGLHLFGYEYSRMWALYGENHKGVCIELDKTKFITENSAKIKSDLFKEIAYEDYSTNRPIEHKTVDYSEVERLGLSTYVRDIFRPEHLDYLFFTKNNEWESENECRLIYFSDIKENEYCTIGNCINRIILGVDFNNNYYSSIAKNFDSISIHKLFYSDTRLFPGEINN